MEFDSGGGGEKKNFRPKVTYVVKDTTVCPLCDHAFNREQLISGGGRLNADIVTDTLHRLYKESKTYGNIYPIIYTIVVCPNCFFSSMPSDFTNLPDENKEKINEIKYEWREFVKKLIGTELDFNTPRELEHGAAGYALAVMCYDYYTRKHIPVIKQAICSIRTAYLFEDLNKIKPGQNYNFLSEIFYKKALFFYKRAIELNQNKQQVMESLKFYGPDLDKNYGYDGVLYLIGTLVYKYGNKTDKNIRKDELVDARTYLSKLFGFGKADFDKPREIVEKSKDFYEHLTKEIKELEG